jgi:hypothetical protein
MTVVELQPGTDTIPNTLLENTIYVLNEGKYISNYRISTKKCS